MNQRAVEIVCSACGAEALVRREPKYEGFRKVGDRLFCAACGHEYASEDDLPVKESGSPAVFGAEDLSPGIHVFDEDEKGRNCRHCRHYVVNPFTQRCGLHHKVVQATDGCEQFNPRSSESS